MFVPGVGERVVIFNPVFFLSHVRLMDFIGTL